MAEEELQKKKVLKSGKLTLPQKVREKYKQLLAKGVMKYTPQEKETYLANGIDYIHLELEGLAAPANFSQFKEIPVICEEVEAEEINLGALAAQDQVKLEEPTGKEAFVTEKAQQPSEHDRLSEASKTNKMHESIVGYDKDSKGVKESSKNKLKIDEENDDVFDFVDEPMSKTHVCELADQFCVAFDPHSVIG